MTIAKNWSRRVYWGVIWGILLGGVRSKCSTVEGGTSPISPVSPYLLENDA